MDKCIRKRIIQDIISISILGNVNFIKTYEEIIQKNDSEIRKEKYN